MTLKDVKKNLGCVVVGLNFADSKLKLRLCEIGFFVGGKIKLLNFSPFKKTVLVQVLDSCFAIKSDIASQIEVEYE